MLNERVLFVDDDPNILATYQRMLRKAIAIETAIGPAQGLHAIETRGPFAVVVADMYMPGMDGIEFLQKTLEMSPDTVRMMLTGRADLETAMDAVNQGNVFRFLTKPCSYEDMIAALEAGIRQYRLVTAERVLLEKTLSGSVHVLTEILSMIDPGSFGKAEVLRDRARQLARAVGVQQTWEIEVAAMLGEIGRVTMPADSIAARRLDMTKRDELDAEIAEVGHNLIGSIPRLESVARMILYQNKRFDGTGTPHDAVAGENIPIGSRILKLLRDMSVLEEDPTTRSGMAEILKARIGWYDPNLTESSLSYYSPILASASGQQPTKSVKVKELQVGNILRSDVETNSGMLLLGSGSRVSAAYLVRIRKFAGMVGVKEPILIEVTAGGS